MPTHPPTPPASLTVGVGELVGLFAADVAAQLRELRGQRRSAALPRPQIWGQLLARRPPKWGSPRPPPPTHPASPHLGTQVVPDDLLDEDICQSFEVVGEALVPIRSGLLGHQQPEERLRVPAQPCDLSCLLRGAQNGLQQRGHGWGRCSVRPPSLQTPAPHCRVCGDEGCMAPRGVPGGVGGGGGGGAVSSRDGPDVGAEMVQMWGRGWARCGDGDGRSTGIGMVQMWGWKQPRCGERDGPDVGMGMAQMWGWEQPRCGEWDGPDVGMAQMWG